MKSIVYYTYPPASLSVDYALGDLLVQQATLVVGRRRTHSKDGVVCRRVLARTALRVDARTEEWRECTDDVPLHKHLGLGIAEEPANVSCKGNEGEGVATIGETHIQRRAPLQVPMCSHVPRLSPVHIAPKP